MIDTEKLLAEIESGVRKHPHLSQEKFKRLVASIVDEERVERDVQQVLNWVQSTAEIVQAVATLGTGASAAEFVLFWIRLYGFFTEVRDPLDASVTRLRGLVDAASNPVRPAALRYVAYALDETRIPLLAIDNALALFTEDDRLFMRFRRDSEAHPVQAAYRIGPRKGDPKRLHEDFRVFGRKWEIDELTESIHQTRRRYGNDREVAVVFARRLLPVMPGVAELCMRYYSLPDPTGP